MKIGLCFSILAALFVARQAQGAVLVMGDGPQHACYVAARTGIDPLGGYDQCTQALDMALTSHDRAATFVNRGVVQDMLRRYDDAIRDFNACLAIDPAQGDAYLNRGVSLIGLTRYPEALADIENGIVLGPSEPAIGYYDRAVVYELTGRLSEAYRDYQQALVLAPGFAAANAALGRFQVIRRAALAR